MPSPNRTRSWGTLQKRRSNRKGEEARNQDQPNKQSEETEENRPFSFPFRNAARHLNVRVDFPRSDNFVLIQPAKSLFDSFPQKKKRITRLLPSIIYRRRSPSPSPSIRRTSLAAVPQRSNFPTSMRMVSCRSTTLVSYLLIPLIPLIGPASRAPMPSRVGCSVSLLTLACPAPAAGLIWTEEQSDAGISFACQPPDQHTAKAEMHSGASLG